MSTCIHNNWACSEFCKKMTTQNKSNIEFGKLTQCKIENKKLKDNKLRINKSMHMAEQPYNMSACANCSIKHATKLITPIKLKKVSFNVLKSSAQLHNIATTTTATTTTTTNTTLLQHYYSSSSSSSSHSPYAYGLCIWAVASFRVHTWWPWTINQLKKRHPKFQQIFSS